MDESLTDSRAKEKFIVEEHVEHSVNETLVYANEDEEPELHARTYVALAAMFLLNFTMVMALQGPPAVLTYIGRDLNATKSQTWIPNALSLVQAVFGPLISLASDAFQVRKPILVGTCLVSFIGSAIAPGATSLGRLIAAQVLIGVGFAAAPLAYAIPSEILPRKWRPLAQGFCNIASVLASISVPLMIGKLVKDNPQTGWKTFYWIQFGFWGATVVTLVVAYRPPQKRALTDLTIRQKLAKLDLPGNGLLITGLTLFIVGLNLGGGLYTWRNAKTLVTLILGGVILIAFGVYEWKGTTTGIMHHDLFRGGESQGRTFILCVALVFTEGILAFAYIIFYPVMSVTLFETDPFLQVCRTQPFWITTFITCVLYALWSTKARTVRSPLFVGFAITTAGIGALASIQPGQSISQLAFGALAGIGFGAPLFLVVTGVQLSTPPRLMATATAIVTSSRAVAIAVFTPIFSAGFNERLTANLPKEVSAAALHAGLPSESLASFIQAISTYDVAALEKITGVTPAIIGAGFAALKQAYADSLRVVFYIAFPFGILSCVAVPFLGDLHKTMNFRVDAPVEILHAKRHEDFHDDVSAA